MKIVDEPLLDVLKQKVLDKADAIEKVRRAGEKKSYYKPVAGRRKPREGTKRLQTKYESSRTFEYETIAYWKIKVKAYLGKGVAFRRPVSQSPADVWCFAYDHLSLTQCKSTLDTKPPKKDPHEVEKFIQYCKDLQASCFWASRYKSNKNKYIRVLEWWNPEEKKWQLFEVDFSHMI